MSKLDSGGVFRSPFLRTRWYQGGTSVSVYVCHNSYYCSKKARPPPWDTPTMNMNYIKCNSVPIPRPAGRRPTGRFLSFPAACSNQEKLFSQRRLLAGSRQPCRCHVSGKGENHHHPRGKGVRRWMLSPATMTSAGLTPFASRYCGTRPITTGAA